VNLYTTCANDLIDFVDSDGLTIFFLGQQPPIYMRPGLRMSPRLGGPRGWPRPLGPQQGPRYAPDPRPAPATRPDFPLPYSPNTKPPKQDNDDDPWHAGKIDANICQVKLSEVEWKQKRPLTKSEALVLLTALEGRLAPSNLRQLRQTFEKARRWIQGRSPEGITPKNWPIYHSGENGRIDIEVRTGRALVNENYDPNPSPPFWSEDDLT
jgi:hypothetical protein